MSLCRDSGDEWGNWKRSVLGIDACRGVSVDKLGAINLKVIVSLLLLLGGIVGTT